MAQDGAWIALTSKTKLQSWHYNFLKDIITKYGKTGKTQEIKTYSLQSGHRNKLNINSVPNCLEFQGLRLLYLCSEYMFLIIRKIFKKSHILNVRAVTFRLNTFIMQHSIIYQCQSYSYSIELLQIENQQLYLMKHMEQYKLGCFVLNKYLFQAC